MAGNDLEAAVERVYTRRFSDADARAKRRVWREIARHLQRYVPPDARILDLACDRGDFITNIHARERWATDIRNCTQDLPPDVRFVQANGLQLDDHLPPEYFDVTFVSNYLEHLPSRDAVIAQLLVIRRLLRSSGRVMILQPNIRLTGPSYWDFIDHTVALTDRSLLEAAELAGFDQERMIRRFLPYTTKSRFPKDPRIVRAYLALRPIWFLFGKQTLFIGRRS